MHLLTFIFIILEFGMLVFYQLPHYLSQPQDRSRLYYLLLLGLLLFYNITGGLFPDPDIPIDVKIQNIIAYGSGFLMASYFPYFFYKSLNLESLRFHALYGVPLFLILPYLVFFVCFYELSGDLQATIKWGMLVPFLYSFLILWAILRAIRLKYKQEDRQGFPLNQWEAVSVYCAVLPWVCMTAFAYFHIAQWIEVLFTNLGFVLVTIVFMLHHIRRQRRLLVSFQQLSAQPRGDKCFKDNLIRYRFSARESEIIGLLREGLDKKTVAERLFISPATVSRHVQNIYCKASVGTRIELLRKLEKCEQSVAR